MTAEIETNPSTEGSERSPPTACGFHIVKRGLGIIVWTKVPVPGVPILPSEIGAIFST